MSARLFCQYTETLPVNPVHPKLTANALLVWTIDTGLYLNRIALLEKVLSVEEKNRAYRFHFERDTNRFIVRRALLKILLAAYLGCETQELNFVTGTNGKPYLTGDTNLHFNTSHSDSHAVIALSRHQLGVDIELARPDFDFRPVAEVLFSKAELDFLAASTNPIKDFFILWTRKEAFVKATGKGLDNHVHLLSCLDGPQLIPSLLTTAAEYWNIQTTTLSAGYLLSIVTQVASVPINNTLVAFNDNLLLNR